MNQERTAYPFPESVATGLRTKRTVWQHVIVFFRTKPLGAAGAAIAMFLIVVAIFTPLITTHRISATSVESKFSGPSSEHYLGADHLGRDTFSRLVEGSRISLRVGLISSFAGCFVGLLLGVTSAYFGRLWDLLVQRVIDAMIAFPALVLAIAIMAALEPSVNNVTLALAILFVPSTARIIRAQALAIREMDYVLAARAVGASDWRIIVSHMVPNVGAVLIVILTFQLGVAVIAEASLSFLGLGAGLDEPSWGAMLRDAADNYISVGPWLPVFPGLAIFILVFAWNLLGDALRDVLDPRLRGTT